MRRAMTVALVASLYSGRCNRLARMHGARARKLVAEYWPEISDLIDDVAGPDKAQFGSTSYFGSTVSVHQYLHFVLILTAIGPGHRWDDRLSWPRSEHDATKAGMLPTARF
jgi:hypothetical protein